MTLDLFHIYLENCKIRIDFSLLFAVPAVVITIVWLWRFFTTRNTKFEVHQITIPIPGKGSVTIKSNHEVAQIAHKAWTQLATRKVGLPIDLDHDVIVEVYNSWYALFGNIRDLVGAIPAKNLKDENTRKLVKLLLETLNEGMRPHLTKWQAKFRRWYDKESKDGEHGHTISPQEIQKKFPEYDALTKDLLDINRALIAYTNEIEKLF